MVYHVSSTPGITVCSVFSYEAEEWNNGVQHAYAEQVGLCGDCVPFVIPFCGDSEVTDAAAGGAVCFSSIVMEAPSGK